MNPERAHTTLEDITDFLAQHRLALVGLSHDEGDFSRALFRALRERGYEVVPVNPALQEAEGQRCYARLQDIQPPVAGALVVTPASQSAQVVRDCIEAGVPRVWLHQGVGPGAVSPEAVALCRTGGLRLVSGQCPFMFLPQTEWIHRAHAFFKRLSGSYPGGAA